MKNLIVSELCLPINLFSLRPQNFRGNLSTTVLEAPFPSRFLELKRGFLLTLTRDAPKAVYEFIKWNFSSTLNTRSLFSCPRDFPTQAENSMNSVERKSYNGSQKSMIPSHGTNFNSFYGTMLVFRRSDSQWAVLRIVGSSIDTSFTPLCSKFHGNFSKTHNEAPRLLMSLLWHAMLVSPFRNGILNEWKIYDQHISGSMMHGAI